MILHVVSATLDFFHQTHFKLITSSYHDHWQVLKINVSIRFYILSERVNILLNGFSVYDVVCTLPLGQVKSVRPGDFKRYRSHCFLFILFLKTLGRSRNVITRHVRFNRLRPSEHCASRQKKCLHSSSIHRKKMYVIRTGLKVNIIQKNNFFFFEKSTEKYRYFSIAISLLYIFTDN